MESVDWVCDALEDHEGCPCLRTLRTPLSWHLLRLSVMSVPATPICAPREMKSERWVSESESEWLENKMNSASSVTATQVRRVDVGGER